jgi:N-acetylglucosamine-6-phosphate deacetylase
VKTSIKIGLVMLVLTSLSAQAQITKIEAIRYQTAKPIIVELDGKRISKIKPSSKALSTQIYAAPGLIDLQINRFMGVDFSDQNLTSEGFLKATKALWAKGITSFLPTVITASQENLLKSFELLAKASLNPEVEKSVPQFHWEGPYISPEKGFRDIHLEKDIRKTDGNEFTALQKAPENKIKQITLALETDDVLPFIKNCKNSGVVVSLGHHNGNADQIDKAFDAGVTLSTHLGNCPGDFARQCHQLV